MKRLLFISLALCLCSVAPLLAQTVKLHKVKRHETIYGIAHQYGISESDLRRANPGMESAGYVLKVGKKINIPVYTADSRPLTADDVRQRAIRMGVILPLHDVNGEGRRMVEYYRGLLLGCDSLRTEGIGVDIHAWNAPADSDLSGILATTAAARCDIIFGPLYSRQMEKLAAFCQQHDIMLVVPFSIDAPQQLATCPNIFQVWQDPDALNETTSRRFAEWFKDYHTVIIDCSDPDSRKGAFTAALRKELDRRKAKYSLTSIASADAAFASAFSLQRQNVVVLNTARVSDLQRTFTRLQNLTAQKPGVRLSLFGYTEWLAHADAMSKQFHQFDVYIPTPQYQGLSPAHFRSLEAKYRSCFHSAMYSYTPPLAMTGFDHAFFFLRGLKKYGSTFDGAEGRFGYKPVQTPLKFVSVGKNGGRQNKAYIFVHYKPNGMIDTISY